MIEIIQDWCKGCELCVKYCPVQALKMGEEINKRGVYPPVLVEDNECNYCRLCELICPDLALTVIVEEEKEKKDKSKLRIGGITNDV
jgi:2-oxoglutarate ferredoxin oxidoreductase subunit delta